MAEEPALSTTRERQSEARDAALIACDGSCFVGLRTAAVRPPMMVLDPLDCNK